MDRAIFHWINRWSSTWEGPMQFFSVGLEQTWIKITLVLILIALIAVGKDTRRGAVTALIAFPIANGLTDLFKHFLPLPRPCNDPSLTDIIIRVGISPSAGTASAHAANMLAAAICMFFGMRWWSLPWFLLALLVGVSRIYNGVHYPYQVFLGWICGAFAAILVNLIWNKVVERKKVKMVSTTAVTEDPV